MSLLVTKLDNFTLLICLLTVALLMSVAFGSTWATHRKLRGAGSFSLAYLAGSVSFLLALFMPETTPLLHFIVVAVGDTLICVFFSLLVTGLENFYGRQRFARSVWIITAATGVVFAYFTEVRPSWVARLIALGLSTCVLRLLFAIDLLGQPAKKHTRALGVLMYCFALLGLVQAVATPIHGAPTGYFRNDAVQTMVIFLNLPFALATGWRLFMMLNDRLVARFEEEAAQDFLSGTLNRRGIERALAAEMARSHRCGAPLVVGLLDLDHFKHLNDTMGHAAGDKALASVASLLLQNLRPYDHIGRFGGDEFLVVMPDTLPAQAFQILERIHEVAGGILDSKLTLSVGLTVIDPADDLASMVARADSALYEAKSSGRNCTRLQFPATPMEEWKPRGSLVTN
jgi:diguanylate cyclase (GGDEF)-like protein